MKVPVGGPILTFFLVVLILAWALSLYVGIDSLRRRAAEFAGLPESRLFYAVAGWAFFLCVAVEQIPLVEAQASWFGFLPLFGLPVSLVISVAYLLRVTFPSPARLAARAGSDGAPAESGVTDQDVATHASAADAEHPRES